jgi:type VI secretion system secreted protein Hcp
MTINLESASTNSSRRSGRRTVSTLIGGAMLALNSVGHAQAAGTELFLHWPNIVGDSTVIGHVGDIQIQSYSQSVSNNDTAVPLTIKKAICGQVAITKPIDQSSTHFLGLVLNSARTQGPVTVTFVKPGSSPQTYYTVTLRNVIVASMTQNDGPNDAVITETITMVAAQFSYSFRPQRPDGTLGSPVTFGWDCANNRAI